MNHAGISEKFVAAHYPRATTAIIAGSTNRGERTATSDIDLLLIGDALFDDERTSLAATHAFEGEIFEVFAYTPEGFDVWAQRDVDRHRPVIVEMLVDGTPLRSGPELDALRERWEPVVAAGPSLSANESALRRYIITDVLDDLRDARDPLERRLLASILFERTAELMLLDSGRWIGTGKWLPRRLRALSQERAARLGDPLLVDELATFATVVEEELVRAGGRVQAGFVR